MKPYRLASLAWAACLAACGFLASASTPAFADSFTVTYLTAGTQTPTGITNYYDTFTGLTYNGSSLTTNFNGSSITGTYTGSVLLLSANQYGGAGGTGTYIAAASGTSYTLTLSSEVNYFGLWFSALDSGNTISFYDGSTLLYTFTPSQFVALVGACPSSSGFCGNPNSNYLDQNSSQQYAYLNFYDTSATFDKIVFTEISGGNFESDNQAVADLTTGTGTTGTVITSNLTPEPSSLALLGTGSLIAVAALRRRLPA